MKDFRGEYFDEGFFDDATVSRFYAFFNERRKTFEESRAGKKDAFESFREKRRERFKDLLGD